MLTLNYDHEISASFPFFLKEDAEWYRHAEKNTQKFFISIVKPEFTLIDAGAQIGMYSALFSKLATSGKVYSFEPTDNADLLEKNLLHNGCKNVEVLRSALSDKVGEYEDIVFKQWSQNLVERRKFSFLTIDSFVKDRDLKVDAIKIDVDSYDYEVLLGSRNTLVNQDPVVVVELNHALGKRGFNPSHAINFMSSINYRVDRILDHENYVFMKG